MNKRNTYTLAETREYDPRTQLERDINWNKELKLYAVFNFIMTGSVLQAGFGSGITILFPALAVCMLWNALGRQEGILSALFRYLSALTFLGWLGLAEATVALYFTFSVGWLVYGVYKFSMEGSTRRKT